MCFRPPSISQPKICPACGAKCHPAAKICLKCKTELPEEMIPCPECGVEQPVSLKVCGNCGFNGKPGSGDPAKRK